MTAFPPDLPADLDDLARIAENDWSAFRALDYMETHWQRPGWISGRRSYHWMLTFDGSAELEQHVRRCQQAVPAQGFDLVEASEVHLTLGRIGFVDELPIDVAMEVGTRAQRAAERPEEFEVVFGPLSGSRGAIRFSVSPWSPVLRLHAFLAGQTRAVLGRRCVMDTASFRPHVSIAYANTRVRAADVAAALTDAEPAPGPGLQVRWASLVELERVDRSYRHHPLLRAELTTSR